MLGTAHNLDFHCPAKPEGPQGLPNTLSSTYTGSLEKDIILLTSWAPKVKASISVDY